VESDALVGGTQRVVPDRCVDLVWLGTRLLVVGADTKPLVWEATGESAGGIRLRPGWPEPSWASPPMKYATSRSLDRLEHEQPGDGGWDFHFLHYSPGQTVEWRGLTTLATIRTLREHRRI
jgi:hypothetical protein